MMDLKFVRKISKSMGTKSSVITIPRTIAQAWEQCESVDLIFDGNCLLVKPIDIGSDNV